VLKKRIIPVQLLLNGRLVKTVKFGQYRDVGDPVQSSKVYSDQDADELVFLNIARETRSVDALVALLDRVAEVCFMPLALGGGVRTLEDAELLIKSAADKVVINSSSYRNPTLLSRIADKFGSQAVVASIDVRLAGGDYALYSECGRTAEAVRLEDHVATVIEHGAGEIFVNAIDRDGTMQGYDLELIDRVARASRVPVIACGGAGTYEHMKDAFCSTRVSALACGSLFNFGDNNPIRAKAFLSNYQIPFKVI
jgi:imidazole glycerol-phosphate synthase subunit HisF